jgi:hypothetical protein
VGRLDQMVVDRDQLHVLPQRHPAHLAIAPPDQIALSYTEFFSRQDGGSQ